FTVLRKLNLVPIK
nr:Chain D, DNA-BINDING PROTEIN RAP1 [Saccharomyces cerevisiae]4BJ5_F Chain F, DNA-BINDING PROTEIN RAP1 [Saccharomyces cerevisiae]4BJ6_D Chain D, RAP1-INTERACTING FACTOR 2 [Saccharomyces cerevisiae]4BJ6_F Chain F, RAP1-INTERACTING FACTOR 2 [Saccharomyces cerevisiae]